MNEGCKLGFDSFADTCCSGRHARVESFVDGKTVSANAFTKLVPTLRDLPIANVIFAHDGDDGVVYLFRVNNSIYLGDGMEDSLLCPNQCRENGIEIDTRPKQYCSAQTAQTMYVPELDKSFPISHHGPLPYLQVRYPTSEEMLQCDIVDLTLDSDWDPYDLEISPHIGSMSSAGQKMPTAVISALNVTKLVDFVQDDYFLFEDIDKEFRSVSAMATRKKDLMTPEGLSTLWGIGLKTAKRTLAATSHQCIRELGTLTRRFRTD